MTSIKRDTTRPMVLKVQSPIVVKIVWLMAFLFAMIAIAATAYWVGYGTAWGKIENVYENVVILKAKIMELEDQELRLRDIITRNTAEIRIPQDTTVCTLEVSTPAQAGKE